jgi:hypothetical protein
MRKLSIQNVVLALGLVSPLVYIATDIAASLIYHDYSFTDQAVSELFAIGAPTCSLVVPLFTFSSLLLAVFGLGVWSCAERSRALRIMAVMILLNAVDCLLLWNFFPMHMRGVKVDSTDSIHALLAINPFIVFSIGLGVFAYRGWFRWYSSGTILLLVGTATLSFGLLPAFKANLPTPNMGLLERIAQYVHLTWHGVLALSLLRKKLPDA